MDKNIKAYVKSAGFIIIDDYLNLIEKNAKILLKEEKYERKKNKYK